MAKPLYVLLNNNPNLILWEELNNITFKALKESLMNQPILGHSNYQIPFSFFVCEKKGNALEVLTQKQRNHHQPTEHFFFKQEPSFLISSFLTFEVLFGDILGLRLFAIVLNHHTTATNHFTGVFFSLSVLQRPTHSLSLLSSALDQVDLVLNTKGLHQLDVTVGCKHTRMGLALI